MRQTFDSSKQGSALITVIIFSTILAAIVVPSFMKLSVSSNQMSARAYYNVAARNLAESGLEYGVWAFKEVKDNDGDWSGWTQAGNHMRTKLTGFDFAGSVTGYVKVVILDVEGESPSVVTKAKIITQDNVEIDRMMYATLSSSGAQGLFAYGMLSREFIKASGGVAFDSWISDPDQDPDTPSIPYNRSIARDNVGIAAAGSQDGAISLGSSDVYGTAAVGSADFSGLDVGWGGQVGPKDAAEWDPSDTRDLWKKDPPGWKVSLATGALTTGFAASFVEASAPEEVEAVESGAYELPYTDRVLHGNQWSSWYQNEYIDEESIGAADTTTVMELDSLVVKAGATLTIEGDVMLLLPEEDAKTLQVIQGGAIELASDARLSIYVAGDVEVSGAGIFNQLAPERFQIWGTASENQKIDFLNNGQFSGVIYAPNADFRVTGHSDIYGSVVANSIELTGSGSFHYDESLKHLASDFGGEGPTTVDFVEELVGAERNAYLTVLDF